MTATTDCSTVLTHMGESHASACLTALSTTWQTAGLASGTIRNRLTAFQACGGVDATRASVGEYLRGIPGLATRRARLSDLRVSFRILLGLGMLEADPTIGVPRVKAPRWMPKPLLDDEIETVFRFADDELREWCTLALYAGLRAGEIATLRGDQLERWPEGYALRVVGKGSKEGIVPVHPLVLPILSGKTGWLYPGTTSNRVTHKARYLFGKHGINGGIHRLRHTFATRALKASEGDLLCVRDLLRHASVATTQIYTQLPGGRPFEVVALL